MTRWSYKDWFGPVGGASRCGKLRYWLEGDAVYATKIHSLRDATPEGVHQRASLAACFPPKEASSMASPDQRQCDRSSSLLNVSYFQHGYCHDVAEDVGDCVRGNSGARREVRDMEHCISLCQDCHWCRYVSFDAEAHHCSWYRNCAAFHTGRLTLMQGNQLTAQVCSSEARFIFSSARRSTRAVARGMRRWARPP